MSLANQIGQGQDIALLKLLTGEINDHIQDEAGYGANIIMGVGEDETLEESISVTIIATGFPTTESLLERDVENTMSSINRVQFDQDSLDLPPFLRRGSGNISGTPPAE